MLKKILSILLSICTSLGIIPYSLTTEVSANTTVTSTSNEVVNEVKYLSEFENLRKNVGWKTMTIDKDTDGNKLVLNVEGEKVTFEKGIYAHAGSDVIYDISNREEGFNRFVTRIGLNQSASANRSDGVTFTIQTSVDGSTWKDVEGFTNIKILPSDDSIYVDIKLAEDVKQIRLISGIVGNNTCDGSTYADAKLVKDDYNEAANYNSAILKTTEYDKTLNSKSIDENLKDVATIYKREFVDRFGYYNLQNFYSKSQNHKNMINYIFANTDILKMFIEVGELNASESAATVLDNFYAIYDKHRYDFMNNNYLKIAISTAFAGGSNIVFWAGGKAQDVVERYNIYKDFITDTKSAWSWTQEERNQFNSLPIAMMKYTVDSRQNNDEMKWFADYVKNTKNKSFDAYAYVEYKGVYPFNNPAYYGDNAAPYIEKYKMDGYNINTEDPNTIRWYAVMEIDGVCGALAKTYAGLREAFGYPAGVVHQPGHAATILYDGTKWQLSNDVYGWAQSRDEMGQMPLNWGMKSWNSDRSASYVFLTQDVLDDSDGFTKATLINILAEAKAEAGDIKGAQEYYKKALEAQPNNLDSMYGLIQVCLSDESKVEADYLALQKDIAKNFKLYPFPMLDLMKLIESKVSGENTVTFDLVRNEALADAADTTEAEHIQYKEIVNIANTLIGVNKVEMASFSFDGENAGKIMMNEKYSASKIRVEYSLDGGQNWTATEEQQIQLNASQLDSITADNDIKVRLVGANSNIFTIDIKAGVVPSTKTYKINDLENFILGDISHLQFKNSFTGVWTDYVAGGVFSGNQDITFRNKAFGTTLASEEGVLTFTENETTNGKTYIKLNNFEVVGATTSEDTLKNVNSLLDGNDDTSFVSSNIGTGEKSITLKLKEAKELTSVVYTPFTQKGRITELEVQVSTNGTDFTTVKTQALGDNFDVKTIDFEAVNAQYVKLIAKKTSAPNAADYNLYFSGKGFQFYEVAK